MKFSDIDKNYIDIIRHEFDWLYSIMSKEQIIEFERKLSAINRFIIDGIFTMIEPIERTLIEKITDNAISTFKISKN